MGKGTDRFMDSKLTQDQVKHLFEYRDGELYWRVSLSYRLKIGAKAGTISSNGYLRTKIKGKLYLNHRIIFLMFYGYLPEKVDHIDNNPLNNRINNLRSASSSQNQHNAKIRADNTSGIKGVCWIKRDKKWRVQLQVNGKKMAFGHYNDIELAELVAQEVRLKLHEEFARHA